MGLLLERYAIVAAIDKWVVPMVITNKHKKSEKEKDTKNIMVVFSGVLVDGWRVDVRCWGDGGILLKLMLVVLS
jgi:hypothetical protein